MVVLSVIGALVTALGAGVWAVGREKGFWGMPAASRALVADPMAEPAFPNATLVFSSDPHSGFSLEPPLPVAVRCFRADPSANPALTPAALLTGLTAKAKSSGWVQPADVPSTGSAADPMTWGALKGTPGGSNRPMILAIQPMADALTGSTPVIDDAVCVTVTYLREGTSTP